MSAATLPAYQYEGSELELFQHAVNWKTYYRSHLRPYLRGKVLEVGAGIGATARLLCEAGQEHWTSLEPDEGLAVRMRETLRTQPLPVPHELLVGTLAYIGPSRVFDSIVYIDVLEHIDQDREEMAQAAEHLAPGGALIVLAPAHQWLYSPFDKAIGHYRRYSRESLAQVQPNTLVAERLFYLDAVGLLASLANKLLLKSAMPTAKQLRFWDSVLVRMSRLADPLTGYRLGKTVVGIWRNDGQSSPPHGREGQP